MTVQFCTKTRYTRLEQWNCFSFFFLISNKCLWPRMARMEMDYNLATLGQLFQVCGWVYYGFLFFCPPPGGGTLPENLGVCVCVCAGHSLKPLPYFRSKYVIFPTPFQTWSKIGHPILDLSRKYFSLPRRLRGASNSDINQNTMLDRSL